MRSAKHSFSGKSVSYYFDADLSYLEQLVEKEHAVLITDENLYGLHTDKFTGWKTIVLKPGEAYKQQAAVDGIINQLMQLRADRKTFIVGIGGGVVTDIAGYAACVYMRGLPFGFVPTTVLGMTDAAIGGKNGIDVGVYKNLVGLIRQPEFLLFDYSLLKTLPSAEWINGFAEVIKHACIKDPELFEVLEKHALHDFQHNKTLLVDLIEKNVAIKTAVVLQDEAEKGDRKLLNFGHSFGHAIENLYQLPHGHAVSIGMVIAATISEKLNGFGATEKERLIRLLQKYDLPVALQFDKDKVLDTLKMDKKKEKDSLHFILLNRIGEGVIRAIPINDIKELI